MEKSFDFKRKMILEEYYIGNYYFYTDESGYEYCAYFNKLSMIIYKYDKSDYTKPIEVGIGYRRSNNEPYYIDTNNMLFVFFFYGVCEEILDKFTGRKTIEDYVFNTSDNQNLDKRFTKYSNDLNDIKIYQALDEESFKDFLDELYCFSYLIENVVTALDQCGKNDGTNKPIKKIFSIETQSNS